MPLMTGYAETGLSTLAVFIRRRKSDGAWWNTSGTPGFETYNATNIASYAISATETGATGIYTASDPAAYIDGDYLLIKKAGASLTVSDVTTGIRWQDNAEIAEGIWLFSTLSGGPGGSAVAKLNSIDSNVTTLLSRITSTLFSGITSLSQWLGLLAGKQTGNSTARTEMRATGAGSGTYDETTDSQEAIRDRGDTSWGSGGLTVGSIADAVWDEAMAGHVTAGTAGANLVNANPSGDGTVMVNHNYGGTNNLAYQTDSNIGIDNAGIKIYLTSDYDAERIGNQYVVATSATDVNGHWVRAAMLDPASYTVVFFKQGSYGPEARQITVT